MYLVYNTVILLEPLNMHRNNMDSHFDVYNRILHYNTGILFHALTAREIPAPASCNEAESVWHSPEYMR